MKRVVIIALVAVAVCSSGLAQTRAQVSAAWDAVSSQTAVLKASMRGQNPSPEIIDANAQALAVALEQFGAVTLTTPTLFLRRAGRMSESLRDTDWP